MTIQDVDSEFQKRVLKDMRLMEIRSRIRHGTATFADTAEYNDRASTILGDVLSGQMPSTPDGERAKLCKYMLRHLYDDTNEMCTAVQQTLDKAQGLHLAPQKAPFPTERVQAIAGSLEDKTVPMETTQRRARSSATVGRSFHDDRMKAEADFRSRAGLKCYIVRNGGAKCCEWCAAMVGRYAYGDEPGDVYRRHDNCSCTVIYENGRQRQDVWSKRSWEAPAEGAGADALTVFTDETRPEGAAEAVRLTAQQARAAEAQHPVISFTPAEAKSKQDGLTNGGNSGTMNTENQKTLRQMLADGTVSIQINPEMQNRHFLGTKEYKEFKDRGIEESYFYSWVTYDFLQRFLREYAGTGDVYLYPNGKTEEYFDFGFDIAYDTRWKRPTSWVRVSYAKRRTHFSPYSPRPKEGEDDEIES